MIFIDTGAFLARHLPRDQHHRTAVKGWDALATRGWHLYTSNFVVDETVTLLARWASPEFAAERAESILTSQALEVLRPDVDDELAAIDTLRKLADQRPSFTDCTSFVLMRRRGIDRVFGFDRHFEHAGFSRWPDEMFGR